MPSASGRSSGERNLRFLSAGTGTRGVLFAECRSPVSPLARIVAGRLLDLPKAPAAERRGEEAPVWRSPESSSRQSRAESSWPSRPDPPGLQTRSNSAATRSGRGANMAPNMLNNHVERLVGIRQLLGIAFLETDFEVLGSGPLPGLLQQVCGDIDAGNFSASFARRESRYCRCRRRHRAPGCQALRSMRATKFCSFAGDEICNLAEIAGHPGGFHSGLELREIG